MSLNSKLDKIGMGKCLRQSRFKRYYITINNNIYKTLIKTLTPTCVSSNLTTQAIVYKGFQEIEGFYFFDRNMVIVNIENRINYLKNQIK